MPQNIYRLYRIPINNTEVMFPIITLVRDISNPDLQFPTSAKV